MVINEDVASLDDARRRVHDRFPFPGFLDGALRTTKTIADTVRKYIPPGSKILDFGCGPCDKTAVIQALGYECSGFDDLQDDWHLMSDNTLKIRTFAREFGINLKLASDGYLPFEKDSFDMVMMHDVLEHLHDSPRELLNDLAELIKTGGLLFITVPNAGNIRKRLALAAGKTNLPRFPTYYWYPGKWRGHVREYVKDDLRVLCSFLGFEIVALDSCHHMLRVVPRVVLPSYLLLTQLFRGWRDSWLLLAKKPEHWRPRKSLSKGGFAKLIGPFSPFYMNES